MKRRKEEEKGKKRREEGRKKQEPGGRERSNRSKRRVGRSPVRERSCRAALLYLLYRRLTRRLCGLIWCFWALAILKRGLCQSEGAGQACILDSGSTALVKISQSYGRTELEKATRY
ncbi:hypothetical protein BJX76DRAFT_30336 [Aspergillus varians]